MSLLLNGDCLELMKEIEDDSVDLIFCDLPYGQTSCKWDCKIDLDKFWIEILRIKKLRTPIFFTTTTKFGVSLITSAPKKCHFRYDIVWVKSAPAGFLSAKKMPMRKHEMVYVFYEKLPFYDLSSHKHKFIKPNIKNEPTNKKEDDLYGVESGNAGRKKGFHQTQYNPPLPVSVVKQEKQVIKGKNNTYNTEGRKTPIVREKAGKYETPLPVSVVNEGLADGQTLGDKGNECYGKFSYYNNGVKGYEPSLPVSVVKELDEKYKNKGGLYSKVSRNGLVKNEPHYNPPLPVSVVKQEPEPEPEPLPVSVVNEEKNSNKNSELYGELKDNGYYHLRKNGETTAYEPPLPNTMLEIKSTRGKHSTEKPVALMEWILKYYSKEGDVVLDPTMGSGSTGVACKNMNRNFIGIEMDEDIYDSAVKRIEG
jgi:hypothetical protein